MRQRAYPTKKKLGNAPQRPTQITSTCTPSGLDASPSGETTEDAARTCPAVSQNVIARLFRSGTPRLWHSGQFDLDVHAGSQIKLHQRVDRLGRRLHNVKHALVCADLKLFTALLVD